MQFVPLYSITPIEFRRLLRQHVVPMFPGSKIDKAEDGKKISMHNATMRDPSHIIVRWPGTTKCQFNLVRPQYFSKSDVTLIHHVIANLHRASVLFKSPFFEDLVSPAIRQTVAQIVAPGCTDLVSSLMRQLEQWSEETYEGRPITAAVGVNPNVKKGGRVNLVEVFAEKFGVVMANGLESFLTVAKDGSLIGHQPFPATVPNSKLFVPLRFACLAEWATDGRVGLALTRSGEILVLQNRQLIFAKRRGAWRHFTHSSLVTRARLKNKFPRELTEAIQETCLDVSFARTGGGIGVILKTEAQRFGNAAVLNGDDRVGAATTKGKFLRQIIGKKKFHELDRRLRQDLVAVDGSTILNHEGTILAAGAIINVAAGSEGGGRLAACKTLGGYGLGVKVSSDGEIVGYRTYEKKLRRWFIFA